VKASTLKAIKQTFSVAVACKESGVAYGSCIVHYSQAISKDAPTAEFELFRRCFMMSVCCCRTVCNVHAGGSEGMGPPQKILTRSFGPGCSVKAVMELLQVTARRAQRENGGLGEDPPGSTISWHE
jgi:hypothetical protein